MHHPHQRHGKEAHQVVDEVAGGNDVAAVAGVAVVLQEGIQRHQIGCTEGACERQQYVADEGVDLEDGEQTGADGDADGTEGNEPQLVLALAEVGGCRAAEYHAAGHPGHQDAALHREVNLRVGCLHALGNLNQNQEQGAGQTPEIGDAQFAEAEQTVLPQVFNLAEVLVEQTPAEGSVLLGRIGGQHERGCQHQDGQNDEAGGGKNDGQPAEYLFLMLAGGDVLAGDEADGLEEGLRLLLEVGHQVREQEENANLGQQKHEHQAHLDDAGAEPDVFGPQQVLHDAFLGRGEDGGLDGEDGKPDNGGFHVALAEAEQHAAHDEYLQRAHYLHNAGLAETVGYPPRQR